MPPMILGRHQSAYFPRTGESNRARVIVPLPPMTWLVPPPILLISYVLCAWQASICPRSYLPLKLYQVVIPLGLALAESRSA